MNNTLQTWQDPGANIVLEFDKNFWTCSIGAQLNCVPNPSGVPDPHSFTPPLPLEDQCFGAIMDLTPNLSEKGFIRILADPWRLKDLTVEEKTKAALLWLKKAYPTHPWADHPVVYHERNWEERKPYLYTTFFWPPTGGYHQYFPYLTKPHQRIFWAGCERSLDGGHWLEGAVHSGNAASENVATVLAIPEAANYFKKVIPEMNQLGITRARSLPLDPWVPPATHAHCDEDAASAHKSLKELTQEMGAKISQWELKGVSDLHQRLHSLHQTK